MTRCSGTSVPRRLGLWRVGIVAVSAVAAIAAGVLLGHRFNPLWFPDPPSLAGAAALPAGEELGHGDVATAAPRGWDTSGGASGLGAENGDVVVDVAWFDLVDGAVADSRAERATAARDDARLTRPVTAAAVHREVVGHPAVELAATTDPEVWQSLTTYVFTPNRVIRVRCLVDEAELEAALPGCATIVDNLEIGDD